MQSLDLLCGDNSVVVYFDLRVKLDPIGEGTVGNPVFLLDWINIKKVDKRK